MEEDFFCQCYSICQREVFMIQVFRNNDKLSTRFIYFQPEEQRAGVTLLVCLYFFYQNKILYFNTIKCLLCQIRYLRF